MLNDIIVPIERNVGQSPSALMLADNTQFIIMRHESEAWQYLRRNNRQASSGDGRRRLAVAGIDGTRATARLNGVAATSPAEAASSAYSEANRRHEAVLMALLILRLTRSREEYLP